MTGLTVAVKEGAGDVFKVYCFFFLTEILQQASYNSVPASLQPVNVPVNAQLIKETNSVA